mmetsp:Transcript_23908/g.55781  ORF Transcript_23908/g.55781 Transcript_23908/m.55781 type:complete len:148 (-) Transcript_23908:211-654(-)
MYPLTSIVTDPTGTPPCSKFFFGPISREYEPHIALGCLARHGESSWIAEAKIGLRKNSQILGNVPDSRRTTTLSIILYRNSSCCGPVPSLYLKHPALIVTLSSLEGFRILPVVCHRRILPPASLPHPPRLRCCCVPKFHRHVVLPMA